MKKLNIFKLLKVILIGSLVIVCVLYLTNNLTFSSYESKIDGEVDSKIAHWNININEENITDSYDTVIDIDDISWDTSHTATGKVSPGSTGVFTIEIDPTDTELAFSYDIKFKDKVINNDYVLTMTSITSSDSYLIHTEIDKYTGLFSLNDINTKVKKVITINIAWLNDDDNNESDSNISDSVEDIKYIDLEFRAKQYNGELIKDYTL